MANDSFSEKVVITDKDKIEEFRSVINSEQPKISIAKRSSCQKLTKEELQKWISK